MGCAIALRLAQRGVRAVVIERGIPGAEASSAAAGILGPQWEADEPGPLIELGLRSRALYPRFAEELKELSGIDIGYTPSGLLELALAAADEPALHARAAWQRARGLAVEWMDAAAARRLEPGLGPSVRGGLYLADEGHVSARALARALSQAAARAGATFLQGRYVRRVLVTAGRATGVELDGDTLPAEAVVLAAGSWSALVDVPGFSPPAVRPARGQMVAIEMRPPLFRHVLVAHGRGYLVPRADGVALAGSTLEMVGFRKEVTVAGLSDILGMTRAVLPSLDPLPVTETWSNFRPYTPDRLPIIGTTALPGFFVATGHHRYGILLTPITADLVASVVATGATPLARELDLNAFAASRFAG